MLVPLWMPQGTCQAGVETPLVTPTAWAENGGSAWRCGAGQGGACCPWRLAMTAKNRSSKEVLGRPGLQVQVPSLGSCWFGRWLPVTRGQGVICQHTSPCSVSALAQARLLGPEGAQRASNTSSQVLLLSESPTLCLQSVPSPPSPRTPAHAPSTSAQPAICAEATHHPQPVCSFPRLGARSARKGRLGIPPCAAPGRSAPASQEGRLERNLPGEP